MQPKNVILSIQDIFLSIRKRKSSEAWSRKGLSEFTVLLVLQPVSLNRFPRCKLYARIDRYSVYYKKLYTDRTVFMTHAGIKLDFYLFLLYSYTPYLSDKTFFSSSWNGVRNTYLITKKSTCYGTCPLSGGGGVHVL